MNLAFWVVVGIAAALVIILIALVVSRPRPSKQDTNYLQALRALLDGRDADALKFLRDAVLKDTDNVDAYIRLGRLIRLRGNPERAAQIHQSLTARPSLTREEEKAILSELVDDYYDTGRTEKVGALLRELVKVSKDKLPYLRSLLALLVSRNHTGQAYDELVHHTKAFTDKKEAAAWFTEIARREWDQNGDKAADALKRAQRLARDYPYLLIVQAQRMVATNQKSKAKSLLEKFLKLYPEQSEHVLDMIERVYFELGIYDKLEGLYESLLKRYPDKREVRLRLVELRAKEGYLKGALALVNEVLVSNPGDVGFMLEHARLNLENKNAKAALTSIDALKKFLVLMPPICTECGESLERGCWFCSSCGSMAK